MSNQHRATAEQWAYLERWATPPDSDPYAMSLLELRARVEALEAASSHRQHGEAAERAEPDPAASLVDRVASAIAKADDEGLTNMTWSYHSRAAIREVAAWINERDLKAQDDPDCLEAPTADEVVGWLRDEIAPHA